jgi:hypothetical protein
MARDEMLHKLVEEIRRRLRAAGTAATAAEATRSPDKLLADALEAYTEGQFATALLALARLAELLPAAEGGGADGGKNAAAVLRALAHRAGGRMARGPAAAAAGPDEAILGALLLRRALLGI